MTMSPPPQPPYPPMTSPAGFPPPYPPGRPRRRRRLVVAVVTLVVLVLVGGGFAVWRAVDEGGPLAGRPRVTDPAAGISYAIPVGWKRNGSDLIDAFTSAITRAHDGDEPFGMVSAGRSGAVPQAELKAYTETWARSNAEFFYPDGSSSMTESREITVDGRHGHTVALKVVDDGGNPGHLRLTIIRVDNSRSPFLLGIAEPDEASERQAVDAVLESASEL